MASHINGPLLNKEKGANTDREWFSLQPIWQDPDYVSDLNDFIHAQDYNTTNYTLTLVGTGTVAVGTTTNANGLMTITTTNSSSDSNNLQAKQINYKFETGKPLWAEWKVQVSNVADVDLMIGLASSDTTALDATDRAVFRMTNGAGLINYEVSVGGTPTTGSTGITILAATYYNFGILWDGSSKVKFFINRDLKATATTNLPTAAMGETYHIKTNSANARSAIVDYFSICKPR